MDYTTTEINKEKCIETYYKNNYIYVDCKKEDEIREFCSKTANAEKTHGQGEIKGQSRG